MPNPTDAKPNKKNDDFVMLNVPAFLRSLEIARESIKDDKQLHKFTEALQAIGGVKLTTDHVEAAAELVGALIPEKKKTVEEPVKEPGDEPKVE